MMSHFVVFLFIMHLSVHVFIRAFNYQIRIRIYSKTSFRFTWQIERPFSVIRGEQTTVLLLLLLLLCFFIALDGSTKS